MSKSISTTGNIRDFLTQQLQDLRDGKIEVSVAKEIVKTAAQIHRSMETEAKVMKIRAEAGEAIGKFGSMKVGVE